MHEGMKIKDRLQMRCMNRRRRRDKTKEREDMKIKKEVNKKNYVKSKI